MSLAIPYGNHNCVQKKYDRHRIEYKQNSIKVCILSRNFCFFFKQAENNFIDEEPAIIEEEICYGKRCTANEYCCPGSVCVDVDGGK